MLKPSEVKNVTFLALFNDIFLFIRYKKKVFVNEVHEGRIWSSLIHKTTFRDIRLS